MSQNVQNFVKFQKIQLENLVDFEKCCKTHIFLQKSEPIQPKTSNILPKWTYRNGFTGRGFRARRLAGPRDRSATTENNIWTAAIPTSLSMNSSYAGHNMPPK